MATEGHDPHIVATVGDHSVPVGAAAKAKASPDNDDGISDRHATTVPGQLIQRRWPPTSLSRRRTGPAD